MAETLRKGDFNLEDFLAQMQQVKKMGSMQSILGMMPGMSGMQLPEGADKQMARTEAIIKSMTKQERRKPEILNGNRRKRIADGFTAVAVLMTSWAGWHLGGDSILASALLAAVGRRRRLVRAARRRLRAAGGGAGGGGQGRGRGGRAAHRRPA